MQKLFDSCTNSRRTAYFALNTKKRRRCCVIKPKKLTEIAAADAVDERVAAAGGEDERLRDGVEHAKQDHIVARRLHTLLGEQPQLTQTHEADDVIRRPADHERSRHRQHGRRHPLHLPPSPLRSRRPHRRPERRGSQRRSDAGRRQLRLAGDGTTGVEAAKQAPVADAHDDDRTGESDDQSEHVPEELVGERRRGRPADLAAVAAGVDVGVQPDRKHDEGACDPRGEAGENGVAGSSVATGAEWMHDGQVAVDAHRRHREYTGVAVHLEEKITKRHTSSSPSSRTICTAPITKSTKSTQISK